MNLTRAAISHKPITLVFAAISLFVGASSFLSMSRRENPRITIRNCLVETRWEGASAQQVEDLITEPLEDAIYQIEEVETVESISRTGFSRIDVDLIDSVGPDEIDQIWDKVRDKVDAVRGQMPDGSTPPFVNSDFGDVSSVCLVLHPTHGAGPGPEYSYRDLEILADDLSTALKSIDSVASVTTFGVPDEVITLAVDAGDWAKLGLTIDELGEAIDQRNLANAGAVLSSDERDYPLRPTGELDTVDDLRRVGVYRAAGERVVRVADLPFDITRSHREPRRSAVRFLSPESGAPRALLLGISMKEGQNVVQLGDDVDRVVAAFRARSLPGDLQISRVNDLPRQVDDLVSDFMESLWQAIAIVLGVAWLMMGWRPALVMAAAIPLSMITTLAIVPHLGVELEQFAIASLIIVLGMVVDNAIVVTDNVQRLLNEGLEAGRAAVQGAESLARSILSSTLTTVGAFLPMLTIPGESGEYMRSLPIVVSVTLLASYVVAMTVSPLMASWVLRPRKDTSAGESRIASLYTGLVRNCLRRRVVTLGVAGGAVFASVGLVPVIGSQFFPGGVRDQFFIDITLPTGSSLEATERVVERVESALIRTSRTELDGQSVDRLVNATSFIGTGGPRIILSLDPGDGVPHEAMIIVNTQSPDVSRPWVEQLRAELADVPGARIDVRPYELGPPISSPVEFRVSGDDLDVLREAGGQVLAQLHETPGTLGPNSDWGELTYGIGLEIDTERAFLAGVSSRAIGDTLADLYGGGRLTTVREGDHLVDVELRLRAEQRKNAESIDAVYVGKGDQAVPLSALVDADATWEHAAIARRNRVRTVTVGCRVGPGMLANQVTTAIDPRVREIVTALPAGYRAEIGGEAEETATSQKSIGDAMQISVVLIFLVLLFQYNSMSKPLVVLTAFPLSLIGALFGLLVTGWPLGFMPLLGIVALAGTVINNAIVLIEFIETEVSGGADLEDAIARAGLARMQPILLTTLTTIGGLLPLALFGGPMWAGMSWAMIFGLAVSTVLTLLVIPTVYVTFVRRFGMKVVG